LYARWILENDEEVILVFPKFRRQQVQLETSTYYPTLQDSFQINRLRKEMLKQKKAGPFLTSRSLNVLKKLEKALNHKGSWPFLLEKNL
jgi:hypothetical protein